MSDYTFKNEPLQSYALGSITMAVQYKNIEKFVNPHGYTVVTPKDAYIVLPQNERTITFQCENQHKMTLTHAVFINKKSKFTIG